MTIKWINKGPYNLNGEDDSKKLINDGQSNQKENNNTEFFDRIMLDEVNICLYLRVGMVEHSFSLFHIKFTTTTKINFIQPGPNQNCLALVWVQEYHYDSESNALFSPLILTPDADALTPQRTRRCSSCMARHAPQRPSCPSKKIWVPLSGLSGV